MPELPEVKLVADGLSREVRGRAVTQVELRRADVVRGPGDAAALLAGGTLDEVRRHGKQLTMVAADGRCVCVHLGMTGSLQLTRANDAPRSAEHVHVVWRFGRDLLLRFRDPRRFGGVWTYPSTETLARDRWAMLGPDALTITAAPLRDRLAATRRPLKAALLDQTLIAGLGNIYVDEILHAACLHPLTPAHTLKRREVDRLARLIREVLESAVAAGGSSIRDYVNAAGETGGYQRQHRVYGRAGRPCLRCEKTLQSIHIIGRTTVFCSTCQRVGLRRNSYGVEKRR